MELCLGLESNFTATPPTARRLHFKAVCKFSTPKFPHTTFCTNHDVDDSFIDDSADALWMTSSWWNNEIDLGFCPLFNCSVHNFIWWLKSLTVSVWMEGTPPTVVNRWTGLPSALISIADTDLILLKNSNNSLDEVINFVNNLSISETVNFSPLISLVSLWTLRVNGSLNTT